MKSTVAIFVALFFESTTAIAQTSPNFTTGQVPTANQWNSYFAGKQDYNSALSNPQTTIGGQVIPLGGATTNQGNGSKLQLSTGATTTNDCVKYDANGNTVDAGAACGGGGGTPANPTATAGPTAINGSSSDYMRADAAPAVQKAASSQFGIVEPDNSTITAASGVLTGNVPNGSAIGQVLYWSGTAWTPLAPSSQTGAPLLSQGTGVPPAYSCAAAAPVIAVITSSGTYSVPTNPNGGCAALWMLVEAHGPGGAACGGGTSAGCGTEPASNTSFGSLLTAGMGAAAVANVGGAAGTCTAGSGITGMISAPVHAGGTAGSGFTYGIGGYGGTDYGGLPGTQDTSTPTGPPANTGEGGVGGASGSAASPGGGGGDGAKCLLMVSNPATSYSAVIGPAATAGTAGTGSTGAASSTSSAGYIKLTVGFQ